MNLSPSDTYVLGARFRISELIKEGQGVATLRAVDESTGRPVIIKTARLGDFSANARARLEHEAAVLGELQCEHLAPLIAMGRQDGLLYMVTPLIEGETLRRRLSKGALGVQETLAIATGVLEALRTAHAHGVIHRDIKPASIIVTGHGASADATLIDFGLARSGRLDSALRDIAVGTMRYMAPEQSGALAREVNEQSDLYSVGVLLYECLAGRLPFSGETAGELLRQHLCAEPPFLRALGVAIPPVLDEVVQRLLLKDPRERYQSAAGLFADLATIRAALARGDERPHLVVGQHDLRATLTAPAFVGRQEELGVLESQLVRTRSGRGGAVLLEGESGGGKTRLLDELGARSRQAGAWVLRGLGRDHVARHPFQILEGLVHEVLRAVAVEPERAVRLRERLGEQRQAICTVMPELQEVLAVTSEELQALGPETFGEARTLSALSAFFDALGSEDELAVVLLDDCQWADELAVKLLSQWAQAPRLDTRHTLLVAAYRGEEVGDEHPLRAIDASYHMQLKPFAPDDVERLVESMAGSIPDSAMRPIVELSEGSPFMATAVLQGMVETGALVPDRETGWRIDLEALAEVRASRHAAVLLGKRLKCLPDDTQRFLEVGALLGKSFELELAAKLAGQTLQTAMAGLAEARRRHMVWEEGVDRITFVHDKLREQLLGRLANERRRELHERAAAYLEASGDERAFELAYHHDAAGSPERALPHALKAAAQARARYSLAIAEQQYRIAKRGVHEDDTANAKLIAEGLADVLLLRGAYEEADAQLQNARELMDDPIARAEIEGKLGELAFKRGEVRSAGEAIERALMLLGHRVPQSTAAFAVRVSWECLVQTLHSCFPRVFLRKRAATAPAELLAIRLYSRLAYAYDFYRGPLQSFWPHIRELNLAERHPATPELGQAYSNHGPAIAMLPWYGRAIAYAKRALRLRKALHDPWGQGQSLHFYGYILLSACRFSESISALGRAAKLLDRTGDRWEAHSAQINQAVGLLQAGRIAEALDLAKQVYHTASALGRPRATGIAIKVWAIAAAGKIPEEICRPELERPRDDVVRFACTAMAESVRLLRSDQPAPAVQLLEKAAAAVRQSGVRTDSALHSFPWLATALRRQAELVSPYDAGQRRRLVAKAQKAARHALAVARSFRTMLPHTLREMGLLAAMQGRERSARAHLERSIAEARRNEARYELAQSRLARGQVGASLGWDGAEQDRAEAKRMLHALGTDFAIGMAVGIDSLEQLDTPSDPSATLSLVDRFATVLLVGREIVSSLTREAVFEAVQKGALQLLRGEHCVILEKQEDATTRIVAGRLDAKVSETQVQQALSSGEVVIFDEGLPDSSREGAVIGGIRSTLCAPIVVRGEVAGCFFVSHRNIEGLYADADDVPLALFIATLAGAALENAAGFAQVNELKGALEAKVGERTASLNSANQELDESLRHLRETQRQLIDASRRAGMSEVATSILHNLGNALNSAGISCEILTQRTRTSKASSLSKAVELLDNHSDELGTFFVQDERGRHFRPFLRQLADLLLADQREALSEIGELQRNIDHIKTIVNRHQAYSSNSAVAERCMPTEIVEDALAVEQASLTKSRIEVIRDYEFMPEMLLDRHKVLQILINLIANANDALRQLEGIDRFITIRARNDAKGAFLVRVEDNGVGIAKEDQEKIFAQRFTTREHGHDLGLHHSALAAQEMGGNLRCESAGRGQGAAFTLELPNRTPEASVQRGAA